MSQNQQKYTQKSLTLPEQLPNSLILELTTKCNYSCPYCYCLWHEYPHLGRYVLRTAQWKQVIRYAVERNVTDFQFSGGEALLHPGIVELLNFTRKQLPAGRLSLFTNGSRMTEELLFLCKRQRIRLSTSLQGLRTYGAMTGTRRKYYRTLKLLYRASELQWPFSVSMTVTRMNRSELSDMIAAAAVSGASHLQMFFASGQFHQRFSRSKANLLHCKHDTLSFLAIFRQAYACCVCSVAFQALVVSFQ